MSKSAQTIPFSYFDHQNRTYIKKVDIIPLSIVYACKNLSYASSQLFVTARWQTKDLQANRAHQCAWHLLIDCIISTSIFIERSYATLAANEENNHCYAERLLRSSVDFRNGNCNVQAVYIPAQSLDHDMPTGPRLSSPEQKLSRSDSLITV